MSEFVSLRFLPSADTIKYLKRELQLGPDVVVRLEVNEVDGKFLRERYAVGTLHDTLVSPPFSLPFALASYIKHWVENSVRNAQEYEIHQPTSYDIVKKLEPTKTLRENPFVESMEMQSQTKSMLASVLLSQTKDVLLKKHVTRCMLALGENDAWLKFAKAKGATSGAEAEKRISEAQATGEPESIVIPAIARAPNYLATAFLSDLKGINMKHVTEAVEKIEEHLACVESTAQDRGEKVARVNSSIRQWIIQNNLCDTSSQADIQARVDSLKEFEVTCLEDLKILDKDDFEKCGFRGVKAKKAFLAVSDIK